MTTTVTPATLNDFEIVIDIYDDNARWLNSIGFTYWQYPQPDWFKEKIKHNLEDGNVFLYRQSDGNVAATVRVLWTDPVMWPDDPPNAGYVHGLAVYRRLKGQGIGIALLNWAKEHIRAHNRQYLRLDCDVSNSTLRQYYETLGFKFIDEYAYKDYLGARYELELKNGS
jgi:ribosomal protein S18 acetylase RimI-like enzyme